MNPRLFRNSLISVFLIAFFALIGCSSATPKVDPITTASSLKVSEPNKSDRSMENTGTLDPNKGEENTSTDNKKGCVEGDCVNGIGKYSYDNGDVYTGSFLNDQREGQGNFVYTDNEKFTGTYLKDKREGAGEYHFKNGDKYVGEFKDGQINGKGTYTFYDGKALTGDYKNDGMEGSGTLVEGGSPHACKVEARKLVCE